MKVKYDQEVDVLTIQLSSAPVEESDEDKPGVILDYDKDGRPSSDAVLSPDLDEKLLRTRFCPSTSTHPAAHSGGRR